MILKTSYLEIDPSESLYSGTIAKMYACISFQSNFINQAIVYKFVVNLLLNRYI